MKNALKIKTKFNVKPSALYSYDYSELCLGVDTILLPDNNTSKLFMIPDGKYLNIKKEINDKQYKLKVKSYYSIIFGGVLYKLKARLNADKYYFSYHTEEKTQSRSYIFLICKKKISMFENGMKIIIKELNGISKKYELPYNYFPLDLIEL